MVVTDGLRYPGPRAKFGDLPLKVPLGPGHTSSLLGELGNAAPPQVPQALPYAQKNLAWETQHMMNESVRIILDSFLVQQQQQQLQQQQSLLAASMFPLGIPEEYWSARQNFLQHVQPIAPGMLVEFHGLQSDAELNGKRGIVQCLDIKSGRWVVYMADGEDKLAKPCNLKAVPIGSFASRPCHIGEPAGFFAPAPKTMVTPPSNNSDGRPHSVGDPVGVSAPVPKSVATPPSRNSGSRSPESESRVPRKMTDGSLASESTVSGTTRHSDHSSIAGSEPAEELPSVGHTTVMMRNIPNDYTRDMLLDLLNKQGFPKSYDLIYLPIDFRTEAGLGYAFINLINPGEAERFRQAFDGFWGWDVVTSKVCEVSWSDALQGLQSHIDRYRNSPVMHESVPDDFKPMLFVDGKRVPFPEATKRIRAPRLRRPGSKNGPRA